MRSVAETLAHEAPGTPSKAGKGAAKQEAAKKASQKVAAAKQDIAESADQSVAAAEKAKKLAAARGPAAQERVHALGRAARCLPDARGGPERGSVRR